MIFLLLLTTTNMLSFIKGQDIKMFAEHVKMADFAFGLKNAKSIKSVDLATSDK